MSLSPSIVKKWFPSIVIRFGQIMREGIGLQIVTDFQMTPTEYCKKYDEIKWPVLEVCPICRAHQRLKGHGSYKRNALPTQDVDIVIKIKRVLCSVCNKTVSFLPSFLLPCFQHTVGFVVGSLLGRLKSYRELRRFHWRRFLKNCNGVMAFLRDRGLRSRLPKGEKERAMKLLQSIEKFVPETFSMLYEKHFRRCFMAV